MRGWLILALLAVAGWVHAEDRRELHLNVYGELGIDRQGAVFDCDVRTLLTPEVKALVERTVRRWRFDPVLVDGQPVFAKSGMQLNLLATPVAHGYQLTVQRVRFVGSRVPARMMPPRYPRDAMRVGLSASVLVALRVNQAGDVTDAIAVESALVNVRGADRALAKWRGQFERASMEAARQWKYLPADVQAGDQANITLLVPVEFCALGVPCWNVGEGWRSNAGVTRRTIPWLAGNAQDFDADGLTQDQSIALDGRVRLQQPVDGTML